MFADFLKRTSQIVVTQTLSFIIIFGLFLLAYNGLLSSWHIYFSTALLSITSTVTNPARSALTANLVPKKQLLNAVAANTATMQIGSVVAPVIFGVLTISTDTSIPLLLGSIAAIVSAWACFMIKIDKLNSEKTKMQPIKNILEGVSYVKKHPILPGLYLLDIGVTIVSFYRQIMPLIADRLYKGGAFAVSVLTSANSLGAIAGSFFVVLLTQIKSKGKLVLAATFAYGILLILFGLS